VKAISPPRRRFEERRIQIARWLSKFICCSLMLLFFGVPALAQQSQQQPARGET